MSPSQPNYPEVLRPQLRPDGPRAWVSIKAMPGLDSYPEHRHEGVWELVYVSKGPMIHLINGERLRQERGALTLVREQDCHGMEGRDTEHVNIVISSTYWPAMRGPVPRPGDRLARILDGPGIITGQVPAGEQEEFDRRLKHLFFHQGTEYETLLFCAFFYDLLARYMIQPAETREHPELPAWLERCLDYFDLNPDQPVSIARVVELCGKTQEHVTRSFRQYLGLTPSAFVNARRLKQAERLLSSSDLPVKAVGPRAGFSSAAYFFRLFRRQFGMSPQECRTRHARLH